MKVLETMSSNDGPSLDTLPVELLIKIFKYLEPYFLSRNMTLVCKRFTTILTDDAFWKTLFFTSVSRNSEIPVTIKHPFNMGLVESKWSCSRDVLWRDLAVQFNITEHKWKKNDNILNRYLKNHHYAPVDAVKIIGGGNTVVSSGRDRLISLWRINTENLELKYNTTLLRSHEGWVWDIDSCAPDSFYSCGWDNFVSNWVVSSEITKINSFNCGKPVQAVSCTQGLVAAGLHVPRIILIDPRVGLVEQTACKSFDVHRMAITDVFLIPDKNLLLSISEDKTLSCFDLRKQRTCYKTVTVTQDSSFPSCVRFYRDVIYIGDSRGNLHMYSLDNEVSEISVINVGSRLITSVVPFLGGVAVGTTDRHARIIYPSNPPILLWDQTFPGEVTAIDLHKNLLAVASSSQTVSVFRPPDIK